MHINTLLKVRTLENVNKLYDIFEHLTSEGWDKEEIVYLSGTRLIHPSFFFPIFNSNSDIVSGHLLVDNKNGVVALYKLDLTDDEIKAITDYRYKSIGIVHSDILIGNTTNQTKDIVLDGDLLLSDIGDIQVDICDFVVILLLEYDDYHSILCIDARTHSYSTPKNLDEFIAWFSLAVGDSPIPSNVISSVVTSVKNYVFEVDGFKPLVLPTERSC